MKICSFLYSFLFITVVSYGQTWSFINESSLPQKENQVREIIPSSYETVQLSLEGMTKLLDKAPKRRSSADQIIIELPMPEGNLERFAVIQSPCMTPVLNAKFPQIKSYKAYSLDRPQNNARIDVSHLGFRASIKTDEGSVFIDPYANGAMEHYITYYTKNHVDELNNNSTICGTQDGEVSFTDDPHLPQELYLSTRDPLEPIDMRSYRLAFSCTGEWGAARGGVENSLAMINTGVNRLNQIFENELALRFVLVDDNDLIIQTDGATDPYENHNTGGSLIGQNTGAINNIIGGDSYDMGHIFAHCTDVGGVAFLGSICNPGNKAGGSTCFFGNNVTGVVVNITAHEMGHQMSAQHTMSQCFPGAQVGNSAYEPGSGSTIMSYAGLCGSNDVQNFNYDTYHNHSLQEMFSYTRNGNGGDCGEKIETGNTAPEAIAPYASGFYIPISTPLELTGEAYDPDGDNLTYSWEQHDLAPDVPLGEPAGNCAIFRTYQPSESRTRVLPKIETVINNTEDRTELLPTYNRDVTMRFIVRDNNPEAGAIEWDEVKFHATEEAGPFKVLYPNEFEQFTVGDTVTVTWDVANTDGALVNSQKMSIWLSYQAGLKKDYLLATNTDNDGMEDIIIPNHIGSLHRIYVQADDNIFFDISDREFKINEPTEPGIFMDVFPKFNQVCLPEILNYTLKSEALLGYSEPVHYEIISGMPSGAIATFDQNDVSPDSEVNMNLDLSGVTATGEFSIVIRATSGTIVRDRTIMLETRGTDFSSLEMLTPEVNTSGLNGAPDFSWTSVPDADSYSIQISTSPDFAPENIIIQVDNIYDTFYTPNTFFEKNSQFFWRISATNSCKTGSFSETRMFGTATLSCNTGVAGGLPVNISQSGLPTVEGLVPVAQSGTVLEVNIKKIKGLHERVSDLVASVISPSGTEVILFSEICGNSSNYNVGFNDDSPLPIDCPISTGATFQPEEPFSVFNGEDAQGIWKIVIKDVDAGNGGTFDEATIEICSNSTLAPPILINNNTLQLPPETRNLIKFDHLLSEDADNTVEEIQYILVTEPLEGDVMINNTVIAVGETFTQKDIDDGKIRYRNNQGSTATNDHFNFTVNDGNGGWVGITQFDIEIDASFTSDVNEVDVLEGVSIFPNPTSGSFTVKIENNVVSDYNLVITSVDGKIMHSSIEYSKSKLIDINQFANGTYFIEISSGTSVYNTKLIKIK